MLVDDTHDLMTDQEFKDLTEHSCTIPTCTTIGKLWKRGVAMFNLGGGSIFGPFSLKDLLSDSLSSVDPTPVDLKSIYVNHLVTNHSWTIEEAEQLVDELLSEDLAPKKKTKRKTVGKKTPKGV